LVVIRLGLQFLEDVRIINVVFNWVCDWIMSGLMWIFEIRFSDFLYPLKLHLLLYFISEQWFLLLSLYITILLQLNLLITILLHFFHLLIVHFRRLKTIEFLHSQLLLKYIFHCLQFLMFSPLVIVLSPEERRSSIQIPIDKTFISRYFIFMIIHKPVLTIASAQLISRLISNILKRALFWITGRLAWPIIYRIPLAHMKTLLFLTLPLLFLKLNSSFQLVMINAFEGIFVIKAWILCNFDIFNEVRINFLVHEFPVMFGECIVDSI